MHLIGPIISIINPCCMIYLYLYNISVSQESTISTNYQVLSYTNELPLTNVFDSIWLSKNNAWNDNIVPIILVFWNVNEKHFTYAGSDQFSILIYLYQLCSSLLIYLYQLCSSYVFLFVVWDLLGKELTHMSCVWVIMSQQNHGTTALLSGQD